MKKCFEMIAILTAIILGFTGCEFIFGDGSEDDVPALGTYHNFYTTADGNEDAFTTRQAQLVAIGKYCNVWYVEQHKSYINFLESDFSKLAMKFDNLFKKEISIFGSNATNVKYNNTIDLSNPSKINILIFDIDGDSSETQTGGTFGYFYSVDLFTNDYFIEEKITLRSNECELFYVDSYFFKVDPDSVYSTLAHEFQHMLHFINKQLVQRLKASETWYNEMLSMCAEELLQSTLQIGDDNSPKSRLRWTNVGSNNGFSTIFKIEDISGSFDYANAYYLGAYLMHNYDGVKIIKKLASNNQINQDSIVSALIEASNSTITSYNDLLVNYGKSLADGYFKPVDDSSYPLSSIVMKDYTIRNLYNLPNAYKDMIPGNETNLINGVNSFPYYYKADAQISLRPTGFSVHYLGELNSTQKLSFSKPLSNDIKVLFYCDGYSEDITKLTEYNIDSKFYGKKAFLIKSNVGKDEVSADNTGKCTNQISYSSSNIINRNINIANSTIEKPKYTRIDRNESPDQINELLRMLTKE